MFRRFSFSYDRPLNFMQKFSLPNIEKDQDLETCVVIIAKDRKDRGCYWNLRHGGQDCPWTSCVTYTDP